MEKSSPSESAASQTAHILSLSGLEFVTALSSGALSRPPMADLLPFTLLKPNEGSIELRATPEARFLNTLKTVHGGWIMTMLDTAMALAAQTAVGAGELCPTQETSVKFIRPIFADNTELRVLGNIISRTRTLITLEGRVESLEGKLHAHGTSTCMIVAAKS